jgi:hypothetical protein
MQAINKTQFESEFNFSLARLTNAEKITKVELLALSRSTLVALHQLEETHGDIGYINRLVAVLSPVNRRVAIEYYKEFSGFRYDDKKGVFTSKDKKHYAEVKEQALTFLEDPLNNIWVWSDRNIDIEKPEFDYAMLTKGAKKLLDKADKEGFKQVEVLRAFMDNGVTLESLLELLEEMGHEVAFQ